jgi:hypothetical protein
MPFHGNYLWIKCADCPLISIQQDTRYVDDTTVDVTIDEIDLCQSCLLFDNRIRDNQAEFLKDQKVTAYLLNSTTIRLQKYLHNPATSNPVANSVVLSFPSWVKSIQRGESQFGNSWGLDISIDEADPLKSLVSWSWRSNIDDVLLRYTPNSSQIRDAGLTLRFYRPNASVTILPIIRWEVIEFL